MNRVKLTGKVRRGLVIALKLLEDSFDDSKPPSLTAFKKLSGGDRADYRAAEKWLAQNRADELHKSVSEQKPLNQGAPGGYAGAMDRRGFTLIELLVVVAVVALLIGLLSPSLRGSRDASRNAKCLSNLRQLSAAHAVYRTGWKRWPGSWDDLELDPEEHRCPLTPTAFYVLVDPENIGRPLVWANVADTLNPALVPLAGDFRAHPKTGVVNFAWLDGHAGP